MNIKIVPLLIVLCGTFSLTGCMPPPAPPPPPKSQLEIREFQTREYETRDTKMVMKALLNVLQDDGFIVKNAVVDLGLITATKELPVEHVDDSSSQFGSIFMGGGGFRMHPGFGGWGSGPQDESRISSKNSIVEASANVSEFGNSTRVRVNFEKKTIDNRGGTISVQQIDDGHFYQEFFSKVDKGIFIQRERL